MKNLLLRKNFQRTFAFLLAFVLMAGILNIGLVAEATGGGGSALMQQNGQFQNVSDTRFQVFVNNALEFDRLSTSFGRITWNRVNRIPLGSSIRIDVTPTEGFRIHNIRIGINEENLVNVYYPNDNKFTITARGTAERDFVSS